MKRIHSLESNIDFLDLLLLFIFIPTFFWFLENYFISLAKLLNFHLSYLPGPGMKGRKLVYYIDLLLQTELFEGEVSSNRKRLNVKWILLPFLLPFKWVCLYRSGNFLFQWRPCNRRGASGCWMLDAECYPRYYCSYGGDTCFIFHSNRMINY